MLRSGHTWRRQRTTTHRGARGTLGSANRRLLIELLERREVLSISPVSPSAVPPDTFEPNNTPASAGTIVLTDGRTTVAAMISARPRGFVRLFADRAQCRAEPARRLGFLSVPPRQFATGADAGYHARHQRA